MHARKGFVMYMNRSTLGINLISCNRKDLLSVWMLLMGCITKIF